MWVKLDFVDIELLIAIKLFSFNVEWKNFA